MSVPLYCTWLKPRLKRVIDAARVFKPDILVLYHSCGYVEPFIPHLMEAGVDVLDPVQPECMDFAKIHAEYGDVLSFHGTLGTQSTMPFGSPQDVRDVVFRNLDIAGRQGRIGSYAPPIWWSRSAVGEHPRVHPGVPRIYEVILFHVKHFYSRVASKFPDLYRRSARRNTTCARQRNAV